MNIEMLRVSICKAEQVGADTVQSAQILIDDAIPAFEDSDYLAASARFYESNATELEAVLLKCLPGGTYDRLLRRMLERTASHYRVSHARFEQAVKA